MIVVGSNHAISSWNAQMKQELAYTQPQISLVCSMASFGAYFSVPPGFIFDHIGAHRSVLLGGAILFTVYFALALGVSTAPSVMYPLLVGCAFFVIGQASTFGVFAALGPNEGLLGDNHRGKVMALQLAAFSVGGALFALVYHSWFDGQVALFFYFVATMYAAVFLLGWFAIYRPSVRDEHAIIERPVMLGDASCGFNDGGDAVVVLHATSMSVDITGWQLLRDDRFWYLFTTVFILVGSSLFIMANVAFIVESFGGPMHQVPSMVALFSIGNCAGRLVAGALSDHVIARCPRIYFISFASLFVAFNHALLLSLPPSLLAFPITLSGIADGIMFAVFPVLTRETFGLRHFGKNFGLISVANALGFPLFFSPIGSYVYKASSITIDGMEKCIGDHCFRPVFLLVIALSCVALLASLRFASRQHYHALL
ncbi:hypothetical protein PINS_up009102 [Pythium insidiosum]|nr:hypothetical protein PINS_up009102 [Pythium insidiosum]